MYKLLKLTCLLLGLIGYSSGQGDSGSEDPCSAQLGIRTGSQYSDNLSCLNLDPDVVKCFPREELCNGNAFCEFESDEGFDELSLDCNGTLSGRGIPTFECFPAESIGFDRLCDGNKDCSEFGEDETSTLCENKCLVPYYGGCPFSRECISSPFDVTCGSCLPGFLEDSENPGEDCIAAACDPLMNPANGTVAFSVTQNNNITATYTCDEGYALIGEDTRTCQPDGNWTGTEPDCEAVDCGLLLDPANGTVEYSLLRNVATYICDTGFVLSSETPRTCLEPGGNWTGSEPTCEEIIIGFERGVYTVEESIGVLSVCVSLSLEPPLQLPVHIDKVVVSVSTVDGTADGEDYTRFQSSLLIDNTMRSACVPITITNDAHFEFDEQFSLNLSLTNELEAAEYFLTPNTATVVILGNDMLFPFGEAEGDQRLLTRLLSSATPLITLQEPFTLFGERETNLSVSTNGLISFQEGFSSSSVRDFTTPTLPSIPIIAPFWANIDISDVGSGNIFYRSANDSRTLQHANDLIQAAIHLSNVNMTSAFIATWERVRGRFSDDADRNSFQVALATNGNESFVIFTYVLMDWINFFTNIGFKDANGSVYYMLPESRLRRAIRALNLVESSNVNIPGVYLYQVEDVARLAPKIRQTPPDKPNRILSYDVSLRNSLCLENVTEEVNFAVHCESTQNLVPHSLQWSYNNESLTEAGLTQNQSMIVSFQNNTLLFGPTTLMEISEEFNISSDNISIVIGCRLNNNFGEDTASIEISECAPNECQDGVTNNCTQLCSRDENGVHQCSCEEGFLLEPDGVTCEGVDCGLLPSPANGMVIVSSTTFNNVATYTCNRGYEVAGDNTRTCQSSGNWTNNEPVCEDTNECNEADRCGENAVCINTEGSYDCVCFGGYERNGMTCEDIDECGELSSHNCTSSSQCVNVNGSFSCACSSGYLLQDDGESCQLHSGIISVTVIIGALLLLGMIAVAILVARDKYKRRQLNRLYKNKEIELKQVDSEGKNIYVKTHAAELIANHRVLSSSEVVKDLHQELLIYSANLRILESIGQGEFGVVYKGHLLKDLGQTVVGVVAVKTLKGFFDEVLVDELLKECLKMQQFNHPNVLTLTGVCIDGGQTPFLVMPFMANGSLLSYLRKERQNLIISTKSDDEDFEEIRNVALKRLLDMCLQVAKGMEYLSSKRFIHRDLAARNCMIDMNFVIKVADFGLAEQLESKDYFRQDKQDAVKLPVKWLAPESLTDYFFSEKSDVWAYGVTCWEVFSGGKAPYASVNPTDLISMLESGYRMEQPTNAACSDEMYSIMMQCWSGAPADRPSFSELVERLSLHLQSMAGYLHIGAFEQTVDLECSEKLDGYADLAQYHTAASETNTVTRDSEDDQGITHVEMHTSDTEDIHADSELVEGVGYADSVL